MPSAMSGSSSSCLELLGLDGQDELPLDIVNEALLTFCYGSVFAQTPHLLITQVSL